MLFLLSVYLMPLRKELSDDLTWNPDTIAYVDWEKMQNSPVKTSDGKNSG